MVLWDNPTTMKEEAPHFCLLGSSVPLLPLMDADTGKEDPSPISSFHLNKTDDMHFSYLNKKRKSQAVQLVSPTSKHKCCDHRLHLESIIDLEAKEQVEDLVSVIIKQNSERQGIDEGSDPESAKDSNSFSGDSDSAMSTCGDVAFLTKVSKIWPHDRPSTSSLLWSCDSSGFKDTQCSSDSVTSKSGTGKEVSVEHEACHYCGALQLPPNLEEPFLEFETHLDYSCAEHGKEGNDPCVDKELDDILYPNGVNPNVYVLSSGRWNVSQDAQPDTKKPTIDQEFEEYFSMLML